MLHKITEKLFARTGTANTLTPMWNCDDAISDFLEKGVRIENADAVNIGLEMLRTGYITKAGMDYYVIDHKVQYNRSANPATNQESVELNVGDLVQYTLREGKCIHVRRAPVEQTNNDDWNENANKESNGVVILLKHKSLSHDFIAVVGRINKVNQQNTGNAELLVKIVDGESTLSFKLADVSIGGPVSKIDETSCYKPTLGDWVRLTISHNSKNDEDKAASNEMYAKATVVAIEPLRWRNFEGEVTRIGKSMDSRGKSDFAIVECEIFVPLSLCLNGYRPLRGDWVAGLAFECSAPEACCWRAIDVYARPQSSLKPKPSFITPQAVVQDTAADECVSLTGIEINGDIHYGEILLQEFKSDVLSVINTGETCQTLVAVKMGECVMQPETTVGQRQLSAFEIDLGGINFPVELPPKERFDLTVRCCPKQLGIETQRIYFKFVDPEDCSGESGKHVAISTYVEVFGITPELQGIELVPATNQRQNNRKTGANAFRSENIPFIVPGERPQFNRPREVFITKLAAYEIPDMLRRGLEAKEDVVAICPYLAQSLTIDNYVKRFDALLHLEEFAIQLELDKYSLTRVFFERSSTYLAIKVPGLSEGRPSLLIGDKVIAFDPSPNSASLGYEGFICEVRFADVLVSFASTFHSSYNGEDYNVAFKFNRTPLRRCHQSVELAWQRLGKRVLFPSGVDMSYLKPSQQAVAMSSHTNAIRKRQPVVTVNPCHYIPRLNVQFFNPVLNERQRTAVLRMVEGLARPTPYVLYGPPGTGKTMTLVEVILQLYQFPDSRILACAPSNSAADLLCNRMHTLYTSNCGKEETDLSMVRLNAAQRADAGMKDPIIALYSKNLEEIDAAVRCRIVVVTCITAGQMYTANVKAGSFTHVVIDEAGHATEPECLVACNFADSRNGQIILAGDQQQLGPVLESQLSNMYGLQMSLLERLSMLPVYARDETRFSPLGIAGGYNPLVATKLIDNYRSHASLFAVSSKLFYDNELVARASVDVQNLFIAACATRDSDLLPNRNIPMIFHAVQGKDLREGESMSWFNLVEVLQVIIYLRKILDEFGTLPEDIGIITPYRKQIEKIRMFMDRANMPYIKVGTVEEFQGQERSVIILSIVRSTESTNIRQALGFLSNPKRMNVALTRAKSLLVVIGNPFVLLADPYWTEFIRYALTNNCCLGTDDVLLKVKSRLENSHQL